MSRNGEYDIYLNIYYSNGKKMVGKWYVFIYSCIFIMSRVIRRCYVLNSIVKGIIFQW